MVQLPLFSSKIWQKIDKNEAPPGYFAVLKSDVATPSLGNICRACEWRPSCDGKVYRCMPYELDNGLSAMTAVAWCLKNWGKFWRWKTMDNIDLRWKFIAQSLAAMQEQIDKVNAAAKAAMLAPESPLWEPAHVVGSRLVQALSELVDDNFDHISWYVSECDFGREPKEAGCVGDMRSIDTVDKLRWLVELDCEVEE